MKEEKNKERHTAGAHGGRRRTHKSGSCKMTRFHTVVQQAGKLLHENVTWLLRHAAKEDGSRAFSVSQALDVQLAEWKDVQVVVIDI